MAEWRSHDGMIVKREVAKAGRWVGGSSSPEECASCVVHLRRAVSAHEVAVTSDYLAKANSGLPITVVIGDADTLIDRLIDRCLRKMFVGEECRFDLLDGALSLVIELAGVANPDVPVHSWPPRAKIEKAVEHKERGAQLFRMGDARHTDALDRFRNAARLLVFAANSDATTRDGVELEAARLDLLYTVWNNMALVRLKMGQPELALSLCRRVLEARPDNVKCLMRRAQALAALRLPTEAAGDLAEALRLQPNNREAAAMMAAVRAEAIRQRADDASLAKRMLNLTDMCRTHK